MFRFDKCSVRVAVALVSTVLGGCVLSTSNVQPEELLKPNEAVLITKIRTNEKRVEVLIHGKTDVGYPRVWFKEIKTPEDLRVVRIESGVVCFSKVNQSLWEAWIPKEKRACADIKPGTVTYVGDFVVEIYGTHVKTVVTNRESETVEEARKHYSWLFSKYPLEMAVARVQ